MQSVLKKRVIFLIQGILPRKKVFNVHTGCLTKKRVIFFCIQGVLLKKISLLFIQGILLRKQLFIVHTGCLTKKRVL